MHTDKITVAICNYNTTDLTNQCIDSFLQFNSLKNSTIVVLDNSDANKYDSYHDFVKVIDNTTQKYLNFDSIFKLSPHKLMSVNGNNYGSLKHAISIHFLLSICQSEKMILLDSDTITKKEIDFIDDFENITIADLLENGTYAYEDKKRCNMIYASKTRFLPYLQLFNIKLMKKYNIQYFDFSRIHGIVAPNNGNHYDTGASFYEDCILNNIKFRRIDYHNYITHLGQGSWKKEFNLTYK